MSEHHLSMKWLKYISSSLQSDQSLQNVDGLRTGDKSDWTSVLADLRPDFTSNFVHGLAFGTPKFYIASYGKIKHGLVNFEL